VQSKRLSAVCIKTPSLIHTAGNDFMQRMGADLVDHLPGENEAKTIRACMEALYHAGVRRFLVSDVPFASCVPGVRFATPMLQGIVDSGKMEHLGIQPDDSAELAVQLQATALHDQWADMLNEFKKDCPGSVVIHFDEAFALERLRDTVGAIQFDGSFFDMTMIHPSAFGHEQLAQEAYQCMQQVMCC